MPIKIAQQGQIQIHLNGEWCCAQIAWFSGLIFSLSLWSKKGAGMCKQMKIKRLAMKITSNGHLLLLAFGQSEAQWLCFLHNFYCALARDKHPKKMK